MGVSYLFSILRIFFFFWVWVYSYTFNFQVKFQTVKNIFRVFRKKFGYFLVPRYISGSISDFFGYLNIFWVFFWVFGYFRDSNHFSGFRILLIFSDLKYQNRLRPATYPNITYILYVFELWFRAGSNMKGTDLNPNQKKIQISIWVQMFMTQKTRIKRSRSEYLNIQIYSLIIFCVYFIRVYLLNWYSLRFIW